MFPVDRVKADSGTPVLEAKVLGRGAVSLYHVVVGLFHIVGEEGSAFWRDGVPFALGWVPGRRKALVEGRACSALLVDSDESDNGATQDGVVLKGAGANARVVCFRFFRALSALKG